MEVAKLTTITSQKYTTRFWASENFYTAPANKKRVLDVNSQSFLSAVLQWNCNMLNGAKFDNIVFNGSIVGTEKQGSMDVSQYLVMNGENIVTLNYQGNVVLQVLGQANGNANVYLDINIRVKSDGGVLVPVDGNGNTTGGVGQYDPDQKGLLSSVPWWVWLIVAGLVLLLLWFGIRWLKGKTAIPSIVAKAAGAA